MDGSDRSRVPGIKLAPLCLTNRYNFFMNTIGLHETNRPQPLSLLNFR